VRLQQGCWRIASSPYRAAGDEIIQVSGFLIFIRATCVSALEMHSRTNPPEAEGILSDSYIRLIGRFHLCRHPRSRKNSSHCRPGLMAARMNVQAKRNNILETDKWIKQKFGMVEYRAPTHGDKRPAEARRDSLFVTNPHPCKRDQRNMNDRRQGTDYIFLLRFGRQIHFHKKT